MELCGTKATTNIKKARCNFHTRLLSFCHMCIVHRECSVVFVHWKSVYWFKLAAVDKI